MSRIPLVMLHHSGGTAQVFEPLIRALPGTLEAFPFELPGRGRRWREKPLHTADAAVDDLAAQMKDAGIDGEFAIFGHSMGAYLGLALAARLEQDSGGSRCRALFASANAGPLQAKPLFAGDPLTADDEEVLSTAIRFGGLPAPVLEHEQLRSHAIRLLREDFAVCDSYVRTLRRTTTESPIVVCCGAGDIFSDTQLDAWRLSTAAETELVRFDGGHFYLLEEPREVAQAITAHLRTRAGSTSVRHE
ncbi:thioesterase II family protein [Streptomyces sp. BBFR2]|uniref:thioesterase II family protein n=1 Tax=Streptomyces sp. BBFR2 TaxID=3372854 RepID=UPI0037D9CE0B